ncbi:MAG: TerC/Alx family metal homeostasis membrane protein, partial [Bacteroidetes bacterium]|nr:TerC/Alx family metal homeostasis membrane protein [Bacteroidota bacterium]
LIEYTLSMDNVFVIMMILGAFSVGKKYYKQVLFWGILGAIILRFIFIFAGAALIQKFEWVLYFFGAFLVYTGISIFINRNKDEKIEPKNHWLVKFLSRKFPLFPRYVRHRFFVKRNRKLYMTPLFVVLILIEFTDIVFALDSIPAIFAVTRDPYIVFFSNIFAIIGLRSLFFLLMRVVDLFHYLKIGISFLLVFVGFKLLAHGWLEQIGFKSVYSLYVILATLVICVILSLIYPVKSKETENLPVDE